MSSVVDGQLPEPVAPPVIRATEQVPPPKFDDEIWLGPGFKRGLEDETIEPQRVDPVTGRPVYEYKKTARGTAWELWYISVAGILAVAGVIVAPLHVLAMLNVELNAEVAALMLTLPLFYLAGHFCLCAALFEWDFFFNAGRTRFLRLIVGDWAARYFYLLVGLVLVTISGILMTNNVVDGLLGI